MSIEVGRPSIDWKSSDQFAKRVFALCLLASVGAYSRLLASFSDAVQPTPVPARSSKSAHSTSTRALRSGDGASRIPYYKPAHWSESRELWGREATDSWDDREGDARELDWASDAEWGRREDRRGRASASSASSASSAREQHTLFCKQQGFAGATQINSWPEVRVACGNASCGDRGVGSQEGPPCTRTALDAGVHVHYPPGPGGAFLRSFVELVFPQALSKQQQERGEEAGSVKPGGRGSGSGSGSDASADSAGAAAAATDHHPVNFNFNFTREPVRVRCDHHAERANSRPPPARIAAISLHAADGARWPVAIPSADNLASAHDESYTLVLNASAAVIRANGTLGLLNGLKVRTSVCYYCNIA
jgi:hypothetical protein